jgi:MoaA/NifB/PqqE/SkfB family radical SAM enzyme
MRQQGNCQTIKKNPCFPMSWEALSRREVLAWPPAPRSSYGRGSRREEVRHHPSYQRSSLELDRDESVLGLHPIHARRGGFDGSFDEVIRGWNCLCKPGVDVNILCTIHAANANHPLEVYHFFRDELQAQYIQLIPIVERATVDTIAFANRDGAA